MDDDFTSSAAELKAAYLAEPAESRSTDDHLRVLVMVALHIAQQLDDIRHQLSQLRRDSARGTSIR